ncbi:MAG: hypothetical protein ACLGIR_04165 [Actinomycetes bacterium]
MGVLVVSLRPAIADPFPGTSDGRRADGTTHVYCYDNTVTITSAPSFGITNIDAQSDMVRSYSSTCYSSTDVVFHEADLPGTVRGSRVCTKAISSTICDSSRVTFDYAQIDIGANDTEDRQKTACHEVGHSAGLGHASTDCMVSGEIPDTSLTWRTYREHSVVDHLNPTY